MEELWYERQICKICHDNGIICEYCETCECCNTSCDYCIAAHSIGGTMGGKVVSIYRDEFDVYIGRAGKGQDGYFGNPVRVGEYCKCCRTVHNSPGSTIPCFTKYFDNRIATDPDYLARVLALKGLTLGCFCARKGGWTAQDPHLCHGQPMLAWLEKQ